MGSYASYSRTSATPGSPVPTATDPEREGIEEGGPLGIFSNAWNELGDMVGGLSSLVGGAVTDTVKGVADVATAGQVFDFDYKTDDVVNGITGGMLNMFNSKPGEGWDIGESVVLEDLGKRWGALAPGGRPASEFMEEIYKNPLSFIGDALTIATAGGYGAAKAATLAGKFGKVGEVAAATGKAASVADEVALAAKGVISAEDLGSAARFVKAVKGTAKPYINQTTGKVQYWEPLANPVKRRLFQEPALKLLSERGGKGAALAESLAEQAMTEGVGSVSRFQRALNIKRMADEAIAGDIPVARKWVSNRITNKLVDRMVGGVKNASRQHLDDLARVLDEELGDLPDAINDADVEDIINGLDGSMVNDDFVSAAGRGPRRVEQFDDIGPRSRGETPGWTGDGLGDNEVAVGDRILTDAQDLIEDVAPSLQTAFGPGSTVARVKSTASIARKANARGTVRAVDDAAQVRLTLPDAWTGDLNATIAKVRQATGAEDVKLSNAVAHPNADGSREFTLTMVKDGKPFEVQVMTPIAGKTWDATANLRAHITGLERLLTESPDLPNAEALKVELQAARRYSQQLWEGTTADLRQGLGGHADSAMRTKLHRTRIALHQAFGEKAIEMGMPVKNMFDNSYMAQKFLNGASLDPDSGLWDGISAFDLDDMSAESGKMAPLYYPMMDVRRMPKVGDFLLNNAPVLARRADKNLEKNTGYLFSKGLESGDYRKVYAIRANRAARSMEAHAMTEAVISQYARPIESALDIADDELAWSPDIYNAGSKTERGMDDAMWRAFEGDGDVEGSIKDTLERMEVSSDRHIERAMRDGDVQLYAVPKVVAKRVKDHAGYWGANATLDASFGAATQLWKNMVLAGSPRWITNNTIGNAVFLKLQGAKISDFVRLANPRFRKKVRGYLGPEAERGVKSSGFWDDATTAKTQYSDEVFAGAVANKVQQNVVTRKALAVPRKLSDFMHRLNGGIEDMARTASYMSAAEKAALRAEGALVGKSFWTSKSSLERIYRYGLDPKRAGKALDEMNHFMNDYSAMTPMARNIIKPYLAPFWGFYRHAAKLVLTMPFEHPGKTRLLQLWNDQQEKDIDKLGALPSWLQDQLPLGPGSAGDMRFMSTAGMNPFNAMFENVTNSFHPAWKMAFEQASGRSSFTGKQFTDPNVRSAYGSDQQYRIDPETGETVPVDKVAPSLLQHLASQVPQWDLVKDFMAGGSTYDTAWPGQAGIIDPETGEPMFPKDRQLQLARLFGYTESTYNIDEFTEKRMEEQEQVLAQWAESNPEAAKELGL